MSSANHPDFFTDIWGSWLDFWSIAGFWVYDGFVDYPCIGDCSFYYDYKYKDYIETKQMPSIYILTAMVKTDKLTSMGELL